MARPMVDMTGRMMECRAVCKPGSVHTGRPFRASPRSIAIHLERRSPDASRGLPGRRGGGGPFRRANAPKAIPIRPCSRRGLPCRRCRQRRGALLPHLFTLASQARRFVFCGAFPEAAGQGRSSAGRYPAPCLRGARTFLTPVARSAAIQPLDVAGMAACTADCKAGAWVLLWTRRPRTRTCAVSPRYCDRGAKATWRSGYAADCKSVYAGSIPAVASMT